MPHTVKLLVCDPGLGDGLEGQRLALAVDHVRAVTTDVRRGAWQVAEWPEGLRRGLGLLILSGALLRQVGIEGRIGSELLLAGDLLRPWQHEDAVASIARRSGLRALAPAQLALLDLAFAARIAAYPEIHGQIVGRALRRARHLAIDIAIVHQPRVRTRVHMLLWHMADRCGTVRSDGVHVPIRLTHAVLSELVAARRPTVSAALGALVRDGAVSDTPHGWILHGEAPHELLLASGERTPQLAGG